MTSNNNPSSQNRRTVLKTIGQGAFAMTSSSSLFAQSNVTRAMAVYPSRGAPTWPLWIAQHTGIFKRNGLEIDLKFAVHPGGLAAMVGGEAQFTVYNVEQLLIAAARETTMTMMGSYLNRGAFGMIARKDIRTLKDLRGKRIGVGRVGDPPYVYTVELLNKVGLASTHVQWVNTGADSNTRAAMLLNGQIDAALLVSPSYFRLLETGNFNELVNLLNSDINISTALVFSKQAIAASPTLPEQVLKATSEAVKVLYEDKATAISAFRAFEKQATESDVQRAWDMYVKSNAFDRIPLVRSSAIKINSDRIADEVPAIRKLNVAQAVDNSVVRKLISEGYFQKLYGSEIKSTEISALKDAV